MGKNDGDPNSSFSQTSLQFGFEWFAIGKIKWEGTQENSRERKASKWTEKFKQCFENICNISFTSGMHYFRFKFGFLGEYYFEIISIILERLNYFLLKYIYFLVILVTIFSFIKFIHSTESLKTMSTFSKKNFILLESWSIIIMDAKNDPLFWVTLYYVVI